MGRMPVLGVAGALLTSLALTGCQTGSTTKPQPTFMPPAATSGTTTRTPTTGGGNQPMTIAPIAGTNGGPNVPPNPQPLGPSTAVPNGGAPAGGGTGSTNLGGMTIGNPAPNPNAGFGPSGFYSPGGGAGTSPNTGGIGTTTRSNAFTPPAQVLTPSAPAGSTPPMLSYDTAGPAMPSAPPAPVAPPTLIPPASFGAH